MPRRTIKRTVETEGPALHAGSRVRMALSPAGPGTGILFRRSDLGGQTIPARYQYVSQTLLGTFIQKDDASVGVIEHLMAALAGAEIDDLLVTVDGPEPPILDGDALSYWKLIQEAGIRESRAPREALRVLRSVNVSEDERCAALLRSENREFYFEIEFPHPAIGRQSLFWRFSPEEFGREIAPARTFGFTQELQALNRGGLARGASRENTLALDPDNVLNAEIMRFPDEFVRHKILDALGDLALAGAPIIGRFEGRRSGHTLNNALLRALFADQANYERIRLEEAGSNSLDP